MNVISNAIKYSNPNTDVMTQISMHDGNVSIRILNQGEILLQSDEIFTRFWRGDNARTSDGSGLGLSIVKAIMALHDGSVIFEHDKGHSTVTLTFPAQ